MKSAEKNTAPETAMEELDRWRKTFKEETKAAIDEKTMKLDALQKMYESLDDIPQSAMHKKAQKALKSALAKPYKLFGDLCNIGSDLSSALAENLKPYRIQKITMNYNGVREKLKAALEVERLSRELYPMLTLAIGVDEVPEDMRDLKPVTTDGSAVEIALTGGASQKIVIKFVEEEE